VLDIISKDSRMKTVELNSLEQDIDYLLSNLERLKMENLSLRHKLSQAVKDRNRFKESNQLASNTIKQIVRQLKEAQS
jgi:uncharacterized protein (TIGR02449 family)